MTYTEKMNELNDLLASVESRIRSQEGAYDKSRSKYGRTSWGRPSRRLYVERDRLRKEIEGVEYAHGYMQPEEPE